MKPYSFSQDDDKARMTKHLVTKSLYFYLEKK
jgi:hypothetical protein